MKWRTVVQKQMEKVIINEMFSQNLLNDKLSWFNEPDTWNVNEDNLSIFPAAESDFWQKTHYGFVADNGHFLFTEIEGDFVCETKVHCNFKNQYDQAGLMVRVSDQCWVKTAVEFEPDEPNRLGAVVTNNGFSDWSTQNVGNDFLSYSLRVRRDKSDYTVEYLDLESNEWIQIRIFHLHDQPSMQVGLYACSPKGKGFEAQFEYLKITKLSN